MAEIDLETKFPNLRPISGPPSLFTLNGCGLVLYGNRDYDDETGTYIKTHCLSFIFLPLWAIGAYRVADAENGGWYFIGKEPLSGLARALNAILVAGVVAAIGLGVWFVRGNSPDAVAERKLAEADELAAADKWQPAAEKYLEVMETSTPAAAKARTNLDALIANACDKAPPDATLSLLRIGESQKLKGARPNGLCRNAARAAGRLSRRDPKTAFDIVKVVEALELDPVEGDRPDPKAFAALKRSVLEALVKKEPRNLEALGALAAIHEADGNFAECRKLLERHAGSLGDTEGARILGQIYARDGNIEGAHTLLVPYCKERLTRLHDAERLYSQRYEAVRKTYLQEMKQAVNSPNSEGRHADFARRYRPASKEEGQKIVDEYLASLMKSDIGLNRAMLELRQLARIVPVALDLGMVQLRRGQSLRNPEKRKAALKKAEETFLAIRGVASQSASYQLNLGQVYYWLGRQEEGRKLFDTLLAAQGRSVKVLLQVGSVLRTLGAVGAARPLFEEAYRKATDDQERYSAAAFCSLLARDLDERILWLKRGDHKRPQTQADLKSAEGDKEARNGNDAAALANYRAAVQIYAGMPDTAYSLNNSALVWQRIFGMTGNPSDFEAAAKRIDKAVSLMPTDAILVANSAAVLYSGAMRSIIGKRLDLAKLQMSVSSSLLPFLYRNEAERKPWIEKVRTHRGVQKSLAYFNNALTLAPKNSTLYVYLLRYHGFVQNTAALEELRERLKTANIDTSEATTSIFDAVKGRDRDKNRKQGRANIERMRKVVHRLKAERGPSSALAMSTLAMHQIGQWYLGEDVDADEAVRLVEEAHKLAPSAGTAWSRRQAYLFRGLTNAMKQNAALAARVEKLRRLLSIDYLAAALMKFDAAARNVLKDNADIQRAVRLYEESAESFPGGVGALEWALVSGFNPNKAADYAAKVKANRREFLSADINRLLSPASPATALEKYLLLKIEGKDTDAAKIVAEMKKLRIPFLVDN